MRRRKHMKKKIITLLCMFSLTGICLPATVLASEIDLTGLSLEQLIDLRTEINTLIAENGGENVIGKGTYETGIDIKAGTYNIVCSKNAAHGFINVEVFPSKTDAENGENQEISQIWYKEEKAESASINLQEGNVLVLSGEGILQETSPSWVVD